MSTVLSRRKLIDQLVNHFVENLIVLLSNGVASILVLRSKVAHLLKLVDDKDDVYVIPNVKTIKKECPAILADRNSYKLDYT